MITLLIVDDETHLVDSLAESLDWSTLGIEAVLKAYSAAEAIEHMRAQSVDILITDVRMPGMSGLELIAYANRHHKKTKTVLLTGHAEFAYARQAVQEQAMDYLLKPVRAETLEQCLQRILDRIRQEWEEVGSYQRAVATVRGNLPLLRSSLLENLLYGKRYAPAELTDRLTLFEIAFRTGDEFAMMLIRLEDEFAHDDVQGMNVIENAVTNIAEEIFGEWFELWYCRDKREYLVFLVKAKQPLDRLRYHLEDAATRLQFNVSRYLRGTVSVIIGDGLTFPDDVSDIYRRMVATFLKKVGSIRDMFVTLSDRRVETGEVRSLRVLHESPALINLLEAGRWEEAEDKIQSILDELTAEWQASQAHLYEVFFHIAGAFIHIIHRSELVLSTVLGEDFEKLAAGPWCRSPKLLGEWSMRHLHRIREELALRSASSQSYLVRQVYALIERTPIKELTVQSIADEVRLHPVYLSKIFKLETGMSISDYLHRCRMDRACYLLSNTMGRVYEITAELGFQNPNYFARVFRRQFGMTPQEYRERSNLK
ncbi:response regulator [Cohnella thailandensis]|uniref:Response regulator n=1 Tax=Cohnella thailandensis TaxID=557557 RepID=A0A841SWM4_9BACL|nr:response regulator [Cohnella thailandensis]MBB6634578.1 response regulator [Cohnella thailandensis]MBP1972866.1 two-component system response regulator YesN [Cohnella thailandensis]